MDPHIDWTFGGTWPYEPRWFHTSEGRLHYIDEGPRDSPAVVLVHGNPTWGYLWRHFVPPLTHAGYRVIVPDHLGFGRSDKPVSPAVYGVASHAARLEQLLESLDLKDATVVPHDWGGPVGLAWAARHPERIRSLVVLNTLAHRPLRRLKLPLRLRLVRLPGVGEILAKGLHAVIRGFLFRGGLVHPERLGPIEKAAYLAPHPDWPSRTSILEFARQVPTGPSGVVSEFLDEVHKDLKALADKPILIAWGMKDIAFAPSFLNDYWLVDYPQAQVLRLPEAGHYLEEDAYEEIVPAMLEFLGPPSHRQYDDKSGEGT